MKVSREGIVLIKSFEGFRPRAIRREDGGWVIGYGHTLSAREGASVSEADAELLLRYDLMPVEKTVNQVGTAVLNQHQFDALTSFAFSVGVDRFQTSDVLAHLTAGAIAQASDALMGWPEPVLPQAGLRRRAAERALFVADPDTRVAVSDLLVAPVGPTEETQPPLADPVPDPEVESLEVPQTAQPDPDTDQAPPHDPRAAAVSALLGEVETAPPAAPVPATTFQPPAHSAHPAANDAEAEAVPSVDPSPVTVEAVPAAEPEPRIAPEPQIERESQPEPLLQPEPQAVAEPELQPEPQSPSGAAADALQPPESEAPKPDDAAEPTPAVEALPPKAVLIASALSVQRYAPYSAPMFGSLPFLPPADDRDAPAVLPAPVPLEAPEPKAMEPAVEAPAADPLPVTEGPIIQPFAPPAEVEPLVLSAPEDPPLSAMSRQAWTIEERVEPVEAAEGGLFGEDLSLTQGGAAIMRHGDIEVATPASFDWSETGAFIIMGAVGLTAFGAAMAAFRLASEQTGGNETTIIAWVLAVIGAGCVGVSSFNLYRRWGLPGGDN